MANPRRKLKIEPYKPNAFDGDNDGIVQDGTAWERPAGVRIFDRAGQEIMRDRISEDPVSGLVYRDKDGAVIDYKPKFQKEGGEDGGRQGKPGEGLGSTLQERSGTIGDGRKLGDRVRQQRENRAQLEQQRRQEQERNAELAAQRQRREEFAQIINNLPADGPNEPDSLVMVDGSPESADTAKRKAQLVFGLLIDALRLKGDQESSERFGRIDADRVDDQINRLNSATRAMFAMGIDADIDPDNADRYADTVLDMLNGLNKSIDDQNRVLKYVNDIENAQTPGNDTQIPTSIMPSMHDEISRYAGFKEAATTAELESQRYEKNKAMIERQLRNQYYNFLVHNNNVDKVLAAKQKLRNDWYQKNRDTQPEIVNAPQGPLETLYPGIELQPNNPALGNTTNNNPDPQNPLPRLTDNGLNIDVDIEELEPDSPVEHAVILQAAVEHLRNGGSLSDIPNDYWGAVLELASSDSEIDTDNPFYAVKPQLGAISLTTLYWRRNPDGTPSDQGWVTKAQPWQFSIADQAGWNIAAGLGVYPEGANWGGVIDTQPTAFNDWLETMPVVVVPIAWNHVPTNGDLSRLQQDPFYRDDSVEQGAAKRHLAAILHTWLIGDEDRNPGNTMTGWLDGEAYVMPIDFGGSGGFADRKSLPDYMGTGEPYGTYNKFSEKLQAHLATLTPEQKQQEIDDIIRTYDAMLERAERILEKNSEDEFVQAMMPQNPFNYPEMDDDMMRRELAAAYGGLQNGTRLMREEREANLQSLLGKEYEKTNADESLMEIADNLSETPNASQTPIRSYTQEQLDKTEFKPKQNPPDAFLIGEKFAETTDATAEEIYDALDPIYDDLIEQGVKPDMKAVLKAVKENDVQELGRILTASLGQAWNQSTTSKLSVILANVARSEFENRGIAMAPEFTKLPRNPETGEVIDAAEIIDNHMLNSPEFSRAREIVGQLLMAQYDTTQDYLRENGISEVRVYRGLYVLNSDDRPFDVEAGGGTIDTTQRTLSSWGLNLDVADQFAIPKIEVDGEEPDTDGYGVILHNVVPAEEVFSIATGENYGPRKKTKRPEQRGFGGFETVGFGEPSEDEIILIGVQRSTDYIIKPNNTEITQENLDSSLLNPIDNESLMEISNDLPDGESTQPYTPERLQKAEFQPTKNPPGAKTVAKRLSEQSEFTAQEALNEIKKLGVLQYSQEIVVQQAINDGKPEEAFRIMTLSFSNQWNSSTTSANSLFFSSMARELFEELGIELSEEYTTPQGKKLIDKHPGNDPGSENAKKLVKEIIKAQYESTQEYLRDQGITEIRSYRGLTVWDGQENLFEDRGSQGTIEINQKTLSSWTFDLKVADEIFSNSEPGSTGIILHDVIPVENIFSIQTDRSYDENDPWGTGEIGFGVQNEQEIITIAKPRQVDYFVKDKNNKTITQENLNNRLLNPTENDADLENTNNPPETPNTPQTPSIGNYTQEQLDKADYNARPVDIVPPTTKTIAEKAAQNSNLTANETAEALKKTGLPNLTSRLETFRAQQAIENNDTETIYQIILEELAFDWNSSVTTNSMEFFKDMVVEELSESFGIEFGQDWAKGEITPGQKKQPSAYTPEAEQARQIIKQLANAHYTAVQQYLADQGIEEVRIYRGIVARTGPGTAFTEDAGNKPLQMRPLSSWTTDYETASLFSSADYPTDYDGVLLHQVIKAKHIFSIRPSDANLQPEQRKDAQGFGTTFESEVIPIHTNNPYDYIITNLQKIPKETIDQTLRGETPWQRPTRPPSTIMPEDDGLVG